MSVQGVVILDDQDESVVFTGQWDHYADPVQYKGFSTGSKNVGTSCSVNFTGTSILVAATIVRSGPFSLEFNLDGQVYMNSTTGLSNFANQVHSYHDATFSVDNLGDGNHQLTISNTMNTDAINIYIDYFLYTPSSHTNMSNLNLFVDDRDPGLVYTGNWRFDTADSDFRHTSRAADNTSDAAVSIPFTGNNIQFYGLINSGAVGDMLLAEFVLDSTSTTTYAPPAQTSDITYNNKIYDSGPLSQGSHRLVVTPKNEHLVWIDYVLVHQAVTTGSVQGTGTSANPTMPTNLGASTTNSAVVPTKHNAISTGAIAGIAVGALLFVLLLICLVITLLRWRGRKLPRPQAEVNNNYVPNMYSPPPDPGPAIVQVANTAPSVQLIPEHRGNIPPRKLLGLQPQPTFSPPPTIHTDSGIRIPSDSPLETPPGYTAD
ncbi:hypothetical protein GALMADRAFT_147965 [Galerina marginata CBS 339.88]|uniref:Transmembrane protein n=1 Tax=Galerina marginata (strain CBS 339.88) TaxID=685588 RepID=A0A067S696_GALM3|nr:hypothetical protein GALMADRAFT_147965 [Galerina marginata CBS 339.88]